MINPYFIYFLSLIIVLGTYFFGWSNLYPGIGLELLLFIFVSTSIALIIGTSFTKRKIITFNRFEHNAFQVWVTGAILIGYIIEFIYHKGFPLLTILLNIPASYNEFGIPTFHVFLVTFNSFYSILLFQTLLSNPKKKFKVTVLFLLTLIPSILIMNRGMLVLILMSCIFVYLIKYQKSITLKKVSVLCLIVFMFLYLFGLLGNIRVNNSYQTGTPLTDNELFLTIGNASDQFRNSPIPKEFFWAYIYISSPLANLQENIGKYEHESDLTISDTLYFGTTQLLPDFISKRIVSLYQVEPKQALQIAPELNVSTAFAQPYIILGWVGISLFTLVIFVIAFGYILFLRKLESDYFVIGVAILNTIFLFNTFTNMFAFSGLSFQLVYPILFTFINGRKLKKSI